MSKSRLGKGLGALLAENTEDTNNKSSVVEIYVDSIEANPFQPRQEFDREALNELADSIKNNGIIQPITVRQIEPDKFQLVTGERRWRATKIAGLTKVTAIVREYSDRQMMEIALIENVQREDLNSIEEAQAYHKMMEEFNMTQEKVAQKVGKSRSSIANVVRLLNLAPKVQMYVSRETISMGHARTLLSIKDNGSQIKAADHIIEERLSVRETEKYISDLKNKTDKSQNIKNKGEESIRSLPPEWNEARQKLANIFGTNVKVKQKKNKKIFTIECEKYEEIERILARVKSN